MHFDQKNVALGRNGYNKFWCENDLSHIAGDVFFNLAVVVIFYFGGENICLFSCFFRVDVFI